MKKTRLLTAVLAFCLTATANIGHCGSDDLARFVNPMIGTAGGGHTYPGATTPFGFVQVSPDTGNAGWDYCSGYRYEDKEIIGFSHTHLSGTGWMDLGDMLLLPFTGDPLKTQFKSQFSHTKETSKPGYYSVELSDFGVNVELSATRHCAFHRYTFNGSKEGHVLVDLQSAFVPDKKSLDTVVIKSEVKHEGSQTLSGYRITRGWGGERHVYFVMMFDKPIESTTWLSGEKEGKNQRFVLNFQNSNDLVLNVKVSLSTVDVAGARSNMIREMSDWSFENCALFAYSEWNNILSKIRVDGSRRNLETFYTAMYHALVVPNNIADCDGRYRGADNKVYTSKSNTYFSTLSLWDIHRAAVPFYSIVYPRTMTQMVDTLLQHFDVVGYLPMWTLWGHENHCMIGNPSIPVIVEAYLQGILSTSDAQKAYEAVKISSTVNHPKSDWESYMKYGYLPSDVVKEEAVSRTLEMSFADGCVAEMAKAMGKTNDYAYFARRANFYTNLYDPSCGLMRGRTTNGAWVKPFDPLKISHAGDAGGDYTEGNAWHYTWHVMQSPEGLMKLMGGESKFVAKLDKLFQLPSTVKGDGAVVDVTGLIGQYVQGNEPSHHVAYLYNYAGKPWKTQARIHEIMTTLFDNSPAGMCGNDDCGQMSAWYILSALGFYPVNPAIGVYVFGTPSFKHVSIQVGVDKVFNVEAVQTQPGAFYIDRVELNGTAYPYSYITHREIVRGGTLKFYLTDKPNTTFGKALKYRPQMSMLGL